LKRNRERVSRRRTGMTQTANPSTRGINGNLRQAKA
jgi:hypothetical protein